MPEVVDPAIFPERLREARAHAALTKDQAAVLCGLKSKQAYHAYESGRVAPTTPLCAAMAKAFGVNPAWLAGYC